MNRGTSVFSQLMQFIPHEEFQKCVARYRGNYKVKTFSCYDQFLCMTFAQRKTLRKPNCGLPSAPMWSPSSRTGR